MKKKCLYFSSRYFIREEVYVYFTFCFSYFIYLGEKLFVNRLFIYSFICLFIGGIEVACDKYFCFYWVFWD